MSCLIRAVLLTLSVLALVGAPIVAAAAPAATPAAAVSAQAVDTTLVTPDFNKLKTPES